MRYCTKCYKMYESGDVCTCSGKLGDCLPKTGVKVCDVKGNGKAMLETAFANEGIPYMLASPKMDVFNQYNFKVRAEAEHILVVPFEYYSTAFDVCLALGLVEETDRAKVDHLTQISKEKKEETAEKTKEEMKKAKIMNIVWIVVFIIAACLIIWGVDYIAALVKGSMGIKTVSVLTKFLM